MKNVHTIWLDGKSVYGIIKVHDSIFEFLFYPIVLDKRKEEFQIISKLWYTTYNGAREHFRTSTNHYNVDGKMKKHNLGKFNQLISSELLINI
jgi:hypothetical protein